MMDARLDDVKLSWINASKASMGRINDRRSAEPTADGIDEWKRERPPAPARAISLYPFSLLRIRASH